MGKSKNEGVDGAGRQLELAWNTPRELQVGRHLTLKNFSQRNAYFCFAIPGSGRVVYFASGVHQLEFLIRAGIPRPDVFTIRELQHLKWLVRAAPFRSWTVEDAAHFIVDALKSGDHREARTQEGDIANR